MKTFFIINHDTKTRIGEVGQRNTNIDLIFSNSKIFSLIKYKQEEESWGSDHIPISFVCETDYRVYRKKTNRTLKERTGENIHIGIFRGKERDLNKIEYTELGEADKYKKIVEIIRKLCSKH